MRVAVPRLKAYSTISTYYFCLLILLKIAINICSKIRFSKSSYHTETSQLISLVFIWYKFLLEGVAKQTNNFRILAFCKDKQTTNFCILAFCKDKQTTSFRILAFYKVKKTTNFRILAFWKDKQTTNSRVLAFCKDNKVLTLLSLHQKIR